MNNPKILTLEEQNENTKRKGELIKLVASKEAVLIVGAGSSRRVGYPDWRGLIEELKGLASELGDDFKPTEGKGEDDLLAYAEDIKSYICKHNIHKDKKNLYIYYGLLDDLFSPADPPYTDFHRMLVSLPFRGILTTNYDTVLEAALGAVEQSTAYDNSLIISEDTAGQVDKFLSGISDRSIPRRIAHLHGRYDQPKNIILSSEDYQRAYEPSDSELTLHQQLLWSVLATRRFVFIGFSMTDPYFNKMLETVSKDLWRSNKSTHYAIMGISSERTEYLKAKELKRDYGIDTVFYEVFNDSHDRLDDIVTKIAKSCNIEIQSASSKLDWLEQTSQRMAKRIERNIDTEINRKKLLNDLQDFVTQGNGIIIGSPGVGKTYLLSKLHRSLDSNDIPHLLLPIDKLGNGTETDLQSELLYEGKLIEKLKSVSVSGEKAILLFDAFDATRNEETRKCFLNLIQRAIQELEQWNVIVTVRTYDAKKSLELLDLFDNPDDTDLTQVHDEDISCRHFKIPPLDEDEIQQAFEQIPHLETVYKSGSEAFKGLLENPFNLWLLEKILSTSQDVPDFSQIRSEVELLDLFWKRQIEAKSDRFHRRFILEQITRRMVKELSLTVRLYNIYEDLDLDKPAREFALDNLLSDEILAETSLTRQRIAFSHNILFDYAISVLLIEDDPQKLEKFVRDDQSRPIFLRPSLTYFLTRLWYYDDVPESFWNAFWHILPKKEPVHLRLFARLIPTSVIANEAREIDQLAPLVKELQNGEDIANEAITFLLQSLHTLPIERYMLWSNFFDQVSIHLHTDFAWDLATLTSEILKRATKTDTTIIKACGRVGRRLLEWVWQKREPGKDDLYNRLGSHRAVPLVAKTYGTNVEESRPLLEKVLELMEEANFPIDFLTWLTDDVDKIWTYDPEFVTLVYHKVFAHYETSTEPTKLGGLILSMTSTRDQDYRMCQYRLIKHFPNFLRSAPLPATQAVIQSLNCCIVREHIVRYRQEGEVLKDSIETFNFRGQLAHFVKDGSYVWAEHEYSDEPIEMAGALFQFITELAMSEDSLSFLDSLLDVFRDEVWVAFFWKRLLKTAAQFPKVFAPRLFELCIAKPIQQGNDVVHELSSFLKVATSEFTPDQRRQLEDTILELPKEATDDNSHRFLEHRRNQLLEQIPLHLLYTDEAKQIQAEMEAENSVPENRPMFNVGSSQSYTPEMHLQEQGIDTTKPENQEVQRLFDPLDKFSSDWLNDTPTEEATESILPRLREAYQTTKRNTGVDKEVIDLLWCKLTACVAILARVADNPDSHLFAFCREVLLAGATHELPKPDPEGDAQFDKPMYSPCPRHEAGQGLPRLSFRHPDAKILDAIEALANDSVPSVRMVTAMELFMVYFTAPERFWSIVDDRATHETNHVVQKSLCVTLDQVFARGKENEEKTTDAMDKLLKRTLTSTEQLEPVDSFIDLLMQLAIALENQWALDTIEGIFFKDPVRFANSLDYAVSQVMDNYVVLKNLETDEGHEIAKQAIIWVSKAITVASREIKELRSTLKEHGTEETEKKLYDIYGVINQVITRLYFAVAHKSAQSEESVEKIPYELRCRFYDEVKPLMKQVIEFAEDQENGLMFAGTAHRFMQLLTSFLSCKPKKVLHLAARVAKASEQLGYNLDSLAVRDVVELVEIVLADHRREVRDREGLKDLLNLLDLFAKKGWPEALRLIWHLDEIFR